MKLFLTGGSGFIGSHFIQQALSAGHQVTAHRRSHQSLPRIPLDKQPTWIEKQIFEVTPQDLHGIDTLVHLAAHSANVPYDTLENCIYWNVQAPLTLFRAAIQAGIKRFVVAGSCFEYGRSAERYDYIPPTAPLEPTQSYPASKALASIAFSQLAIENNLSLSIHRIFQVYGPGEAESRLWPMLKKAALSGEDVELTPAEQIRDFIRVEVVAHKLLQACDLNIRPGYPHIENLGTGVPQTLKAFATECWNNWAAKGKLVIGAKPYRKGEVMRFVPEV